MWGPEEAEDGSTRVIPETLLRPKADCPVPPDALNAAIDKPVLNEVIGVLRAVHIESKHRGKDKRRRVMMLPCLLLRCTPVLLISCSAIVASYLYSSGVSSALFRVLPTLSHALALPGSVGQD